MMKRLIRAAWSRHRCKPELFIDCDLLAEARGRGNSKPSTTIQLVLPFQICTRLILGYHLRIRKAPHTHNMIAVLSPAAYVLMYATGSDSSRRVRWTTLQGNALGVETKRSGVTMPNFLIIGAMKCGTTSLYYYLKQHPQIYMSHIKAPDFFAWEGWDLNFNGPEGREVVNRRIRLTSVTDIDEYRELFRGVSNQTAIGEASPCYIYSPEAPGRIRHYVPDAKLIAVLRNPADRAYSAYLQLVRLVREPLDDFAQALRAEDERIRDDWEWIWHYKNMGFYYTQLKRYYETFEPEQIKVYLYEDLQNDPIGVVHDICRYLEVDDTFTPDTSFRYHASGVPKHRVLHKLLTTPNRVKVVLKSILPPGPSRRLWERALRMNLVEPPPLPLEVRKELIEVHRQDILELQDLIQRDLSAWLE